jgi:membrane protease YdiL (CAAX protease family)
MSASIAAPQSRLRWVFHGPHGLRAGWGLLIFVLLMALPFSALKGVAVLMHIKPPGQPVLLTPGLVLLSDSFILATVLAATAVMAWIERRPFLSYGLRVRRLAAHFAAGWAGGLLCLSILVALLAGGGYLIFNGLALHGLPILAYGLVWLLAFTMVGLAEETLFRGYAQFALARGLGFWPAALILSLVFGAAHFNNHGESALGLAGVVGAGLVFCLLLRATGSLWPGIGFHGAWDWAQSYLYGTPDSGAMAVGHLMNAQVAGNAAWSGGSAGPEGSLLAGPAMIAGLLLLVWFCKRSGLVTYPIR